MTNIEIILIAFSLAMDAFGVSISKGLTIKKNIFKNAIRIGMYFGLFQALMTVIGCFFGSNFKEVADAIDHWIAFISLNIIGFNMLKEAIHEENIDDNLNFVTMILLSIATSIDALVIGVTMSFLKVNIIKAALIIGVITFILCTLGTMVSKVIGKRLGNKSNLLGGIILIIIGFKTLIEHLGF